MLWKNIHLSHDLTPEHIYSIIAQDEIELNWWATITLHFIHSDTAKFQK